MIRKIVAATLVASLVLTALTACGNKAQESNQGAQGKNIKVITVQKSNIVVENKFAGEVKAGDESGVISKAAGKVKEVFVKVGDSVKEGDILFTLDSDDARAQLSQAQAGVALAKTNLDKASNSEFEQSLFQAQNDYNQSKVNFDDAEKDYTRCQTLFNEGAISQKELEAAKSKYDLAKQTMDLKSKNLDLFKNGSGPQNIAAAKSQLEQAAASQQQAAVQMDNMTVRAPISGLITAKNINVGEGVSASAPAVVISNLNNLKVEISIPENLVNKFSQGQKIEVTVQSLDNKAFNGEVDTVYPSIDAETKNYKVKIKLSDKSEELKPGMFAKINVAVEEKKNVLSVPGNTIVTENGVHYVYAVVDNKVAKKPVKIGLSNDKEVEIVQGINEGDKLVTEGQSFLSDGELINILASAS